MQFSFQVSILATVHENLVIYSQKIIPFLLKSILSVLCQLQWFKECKLTKLIYCQAKAKHYMISVFEPYSYKHLAFIEFAGFNRYQLKLQLVIRKIAGRFLENLFLMLFICTTDHTNSCYSDLTANSCRTFIIMKFQLQTKKN